MTETQFISWLKGFLAGKAQLSSGELASLKSTLLSVGGTNRFVSNNTNESFPGHGKQILHD